VADAQLAADLLDRRTGLGLPEGEGDLLLGELRLLYGLGPPPRSSILSPFSNAMDQISGSCATPVGKHRWLLSSHTRQSSASIGNNHHSGRAATIEFQAPARCDPRVWVIIME